MYLSIYIYEHGIFWAGLSDCLRLPKLSMTSESRGVAYSRGLRVTGPNDIKLELLGRVDLDTPKSRCRTPPWPCLKGEDCYVEGAASNFSGILKGAPHKGDP